MARSLLILPLILAAACASCSKEEQPVLLDGADEPAMLDGETVDTPRADGEDLMGPTGEVTCPADGYQGFVGKNIAAVIYPSDLKVRVLQPDTVVTMEYVPDRMNIHVDDDGVITKIICG